MSITYLLGLSMLVQLLAAMMSLKLIRVTQRYFAWIVLSAAFFLMAIRRWITLCQYITGNEPTSPDFSAELVALVTSVLLLLGVAWIGPLFLRMKRSEETIRQNEAKYRTLIEKASDGILVIDQEGKCLEANPRLCEMLGYFPEEILGCNIKDFFPPEDLVAAPLRFDKLLAGETVLAERRLRHKAGELITVEASSRMVEDGRIQAILREKTEAKRDREALQKIEWLLTKTLRHEQARAKLDSIGRQPDSLVEINTSRRLLDSVGHHVLMQIASDYIGLLDTSTFIFESNGDYALDICASGWCRLLRQASLRLCGTEDKKEALATGRWHCHESCWTEAAKVAIEITQPIDVKCRGGIRTYAVPIWAQGKVAGAISIGYGTPPKDHRQLQEIAERYRVSRDVLLKEAEAYDPRPPFITDVAKNSLLTSAKLIGLMVDRETTQETLLETQARLKHLLSSGPAVIYSRRPEGKQAYTFLSPNIERVLGYGREELLSAPEHWARCLHPEDAPEIETALSQVFKEGHHRLEYRLRHADGTYRWIRDDMTLVYDAAGRPMEIVGCLIDITSRKRAEEISRESEERYRSLFEESRDAITITTREGKFVDVNPATLDLLGYTREEIIGQDVRNIYASPADRERFQQEIEGKGSVTDYEVEFRKKDGTTRNCLLSSTVRRAKDGTILGYQAIIRDITEQERLRSQVQHLQKMEALGTLAGGIAHDFNNILAAVIGNTEMAIREVPAESRMQRRLGRVLKAGYRAKDLVRQILAFSRHNEREQKPVQISIILKEVLKLLRALLPTTIEIRQNIEATTSTAMADPTQIHQVLMNLCTNAAHAMREKGGILEVSLADVEIDADFAARQPDLEPGRYLRLTVSDTGCGMDRSVMERIFDPFFTTKGPGEGTGLGLAVALGIVKNHGGTITVHSEPPKGSTFTVFLPKIDIAELSEQERSGAIPGGNESVLFVDDEESLVDTEREMLQALGYQVTATRSSVEALETFRAQPDRFDLVITDQTMPHMTGAELAGELINIRPDIPVILCTGFSEAITAEKAKALGIRKLIMKPFDQRGLAEAIRAVLNATHT